MQSGLRHRVCVFQKCWRRLSRHTTSLRPRLPSLASSVTDAPSLPRLLHPRRCPPLLLVSKSMGRVLSRRSSVRINGDEGSFLFLSCLPRMREESRENKIAGLCRFSTAVHHALINLASLTYPITAKFGRARRRTRRFVELLSIATPLINSASRYVSVADTWRWRW